LKILLDAAVMGKKINNLIPFALNRENAEGYYLILAHQARFIENHHNIPLLNIPADASTKLGINGKTLMSTLTGNASIQRVAYNWKQNRYHISTTADKSRSPQMDHGNTQQESVPLQPQDTPNEIQH
jgi:hypothetical protein